VKSALMSITLVLNSRTVTDQTAGKDAQGLQEQVAKLYESMRDEVFRYIRSRGVHVEPAREACQDVFLRLFQTLRKGETVRNPRAWIFTVAHNCSIDLVAAGQADDRWDDALIETLVATEAGPEQELLTREKMARLSRAIQTLSPQQRQCLQLRSAGFSYREMANVIGVQVSTVGESLRRAVSRLRRSLYD
jgi:RNA polymerase sigma-70 factor (ECF subfamily)